MFLLQMGAYARYKTTLLFSLILIVAGLLLTAFSLFSPLWQTAEMGDTDTIHEHGLWRDCVVSSAHLIPIPVKDGEGKDVEYSPCRSKFDDSVIKEIRESMDNDDKNKREIQLHTFLPQHKAVLFFGVFTFLFGLIGIVIGICSPCFPPNSLLYVVAIFMTSACSLLADIIFLYAAQKSDNQAIVVDGVVYPHEIGMAAYLHMLSTFLFILALFLSVVAAYLLITCGEGRADGCCARQGDYEATKVNVRTKIIHKDPKTWNSAGIIVRTCDRPHCKPFIVKDGFSSD
ncbi:hpo-30 [Pristionchus pacificus]|uniref:Hpo-30 n=1 Tax=Pristionchus pacificus TaxID=54126 RepID=A0A2A6C0H6_PRIPA|nr:hpo-30 [Pristionchus pacificus]|eukprot:PDM71513.1 hpo-30 [Pristionchus pacificus]